MQKAWLRCSWGNIFIKPSSFTIIMHTDAITDLFTSTHFSSALCFSVKTRVQQSQLTNSSRRSACTSISPEPSFSSRRETPWRLLVSTQRALVTQDIMYDGAQAKFVSAAVSKMTGPLCYWPTTTSGRHRSRSRPQSPTLSTTNQSPRPLVHW